MGERTKDQWVRRKGGNVGVLDSPLVAKILALLVAALASYSGYDKYEEHQAAKADTATVTVNVESMPESAAGLSRQDVEALITKAIARQHKENLAIFKQKEEWEK